MKKKRSPDKQLVIPALESVLGKMKENWRTTGFRKQEAILRMFLEAFQKGEGVDFDEILELYKENKSEPSAIAAHTLNRINQKLEQYGLRIRRSSIFVIEEVDNGRKSEKEE